MAVRRDYLLQLAQQVAQMLAAILGHREAGRSAEAGLVAEEACAQLIGLPLATVRGLTPESLAGLLAQNEAQRVGRSVLLAELLMQDAALSAEAGRTVAAQCSQLQAFCLLDDALGELPAAEADTYRPKQAALARQLGALRHVPYVQQRLHAYETRPPR